MIDPRTPVLIGTGQQSQRLDDPADALEPIDLLAAAARAADDDAGAAPLACSRRSTRSRSSRWCPGTYPDPGALLARRLGTDVRTTMTTTVGGNSPQLLVTELSTAISRGEVDVALLGGAECVHTRWRARRDPKAWLEWTRTDDPPCPIVFGDDRAGTDDYEMAHLAAAPTQIYPLFETALRAANDRSVEEHQARTGELWATFAAVAAANPHAWSREGWTAEQIRTPGTDNRIVTFPYPKRMCANIDVDQAAALLLCSYEAALDLGVPDDRLVFPLAGADAHDHFLFSERDSLCDSTAIAAAGEDALDRRRVRRRRRRPLRPLLLLPVGGADRDARPRARRSARRRRPAAHRHRRARLRRGPGERLPDPRDRGDGRRMPAGPGLGRDGRARSAGTRPSTPSASTRRRRRRTASTRVDKATTQARVDALPGRERAGAYEGTRDRRVDVGGVRPRHRPELRHPDAH